jgi:hypothetical protein
LKIDAPLQRDEAVHCSNPNNYGTCIDTTPLNDLFGPGYTVSASANLISTSFDIQLLGLMNQPTNQGSIYWSWNIFPKSTGTQVINADIELIWQPVNKGGVAIIRKFWQTPIAINVNPQPNFTLGQFTLSSILSGSATILFGGLSIQYFIDNWLKRKKGQATSNVPPHP